MTIRGNFECVLARAVEATDAVSGYADLSCNFEEEDESPLIGLLQVEGLD